MESVPIFDWLRWVEIPVWIGIVGAFLAHVRRDHQVELGLASQLSKINGQLDKVEDINHSVNMILEKLIPERKRY